MRAPLLRDPPSEGRGSVVAQLRDLSQAPPLLLICWVPLGRTSLSLRSCPRERMCQNHMTLRPFQAENRWDSPVTAVFTVAAPRGEASSVGRPGRPHSRLSSGTS